MRVKNKMNNNPIGVYDSGIGGLTVFSKLVKLLPTENFIYFGDTANIPYGTKTKAELLTITHQIMTFFKEQNVKAVVMACNTTSAVAYDTLKHDFDFTIYPLIQTACKVIANMDVKKIGTLSTEATANSHAYKNHLQKFNPNLEVIEHGCPRLWVDCVENNTENLPTNVSVIKQHLTYLLHNEVDKIILGCTHYPYLKDILIKFTNEDIFIDPSQSFAEFIAKDLEENDNLATEQLFAPKFYVSSDPEKFQISSKIFYNVDHTPTLV